MFDYIPAETQAEIEWTSSTNKHFQLTATSVEKIKNPDTINITLESVMDINNPVRYYKFRKNDKTVAVIVVTSGGEAYIQMFSSFANSMSMRIPKSIAKKCYKSVKDWEQGGY